MNKQKQRISNIIMLVLLFFMSIRQLVKFTEMNFIQSTTLSNDLSFVVLIVFVTLFLSLFMIYIPILFLVKVEITLPSIVVDLPYMIVQVKQYVVSFDKRNTYQLNQVIRC